LLASGYSSRLAAAFEASNFGITVGSRQVYHPSSKPQPHDQPCVAKPERARIRHLGIALLAHAQGDRYLGYSKARAMGFDRTLELNAEAVLGERDCPKHLSAGCPKAAGQVADRHAQQPANN